MTFVEVWEAAIMTLAVFANIALQIVWIYLAWRLLSWLLYERAGIERNPAQNLRYALRRAMCRHRKGYAQVRDGHGRNYTGCVRCGRDVNAGRRQEDRV